jgi:hypothetical protein
MTRVARGRNAATKRHQLIGTETGILGFETFDILV